MNLLYASSVKLVIVLTGFFLTLLNLNPAYAETRPTFCNRGDHALNVGIVSDYWYGERLWSEEGWWSIDAGRCASMPTIPEHRVAGYAFLAFRDDQVLLPSFSPDTSRRHEAVTSNRICANPEGKFKYAGKKSEEVGQRCAANGFTVPISFFYSTERLTIGKPPIENLTIDLDWDYDFLQGYDLPETEETSAISKAEAEDAAKAYRAKFILATYLDTKYSMKHNLHSSEFYFGTPDLGGEDEINALHGLLNQNLDYLAANWFGEGKQFADKYALREGMLPGYDLDRGLTEITVSPVGVEILEELARYLGIVEEVDFMQDYFVRRVTSPDGTVDSSARNRKANLTPLLTPDQIDAFLRERAAVKRELAEQTEKQRKRQEREAEIAARDKQWKAEQAERRRKSKVARAELEALAEAARKNRAENQRKQREYRAAQQKRAEQRRVLEEAARKKRELELAQLEANPEPQKPQRLLVPDLEANRKSKITRLQRMQWRRDMSQVESWLRDAATDQSVWSGKIGSAEENVQPLSLMIKTFVPESGKWTGEVRHSRAEGRLPVTGELSRNGMIFAETEGSATTCEYTLIQVEQGTRLVGERACENVQPFWIDVNASASN